MCADGSMVSPRSSMLYKLTLTLNPSSNPYPNPYPNP